MSARGRFSFDPVLSRFSKMVRLMADIDEKNQDLQAFNPYIDFG